MVSTYKLAHFQLQEQGGLFKILFCFVPKGRGEGFSSWLRDRLPLGCGLVLG